MIIFLHILYWVKKMYFKIGDTVTRKSYQNDILFEIVDIEEELAYLKGVDVRLCADSPLSDLEKVGITRDDHETKDKEFYQKLDDFLHLDRSEYFYLPGKILHIDADKDYLKRCIQFYEELHLQAYGLFLKENHIADHLEEYLLKYSPDILVLTGHDSYNRKTKNQSDLSAYQNSKYFKDAILLARNYEKSQEKLIIIAGACQSNYEELIQAGANFASSPKRINIHALDPAILASCIALSPKNKEIDLLNLLSKTKYGSDGMGGIITNGSMYVGYPR